MNLLSDFIVYDISFGDYSCQLTNLPLLIADCGIIFYLLSSGRRSCLIGLEIASLKNHPFLPLCSQVLERDQIMNKFHEVTERLEQALSQISYEKLDIADEVKEQVECKSFQGELSVT